MLREKLVKSDLLEAVIGLGPGLFYNSPMEAVVVTLRAKKPAEHAGKVLFINAVAEYAREQAQSFLRASHQTKILDAYRSFTDRPGYAAAATREQIADRAWSLAIPLYVAGAASTDTTETLGVDEAIAAWRDSATATDAAIEDVLTVLRTEVAK